MGPYRLVRLFLAAAIAVIPAATASAAPPRATADGAKTVPVDGNPVEWTELFPSSRPGFDQLRVRAAYDPSSDKIILHRTTATLESDTWEWSGTSWTRLDIANPPGHFLTTLATDYAHNQVVMFGGDRNEGDRTDETWVYANQTWTQLHPDHHPSARMRSAMAYDPVSGSVLLFGGDNVPGEFGDTWAFDGTDWHQLFPSRSPGLRTAATLAYDPARGHLIFFGGFTRNGSAEDGCKPSTLCYPSSTWMWTGSNWRELDLANSPNGRQSVGLVTVGSHLVLYGGEAITDRYRGDTWILRRHTWRRLHIRKAPRHRAVWALAWSPTAMQAILFGGYTRFADHPTQINDTWSLTPSIT